MPHRMPLLYVTTLAYPSRKATNIQVAANAREFQHLLGPLFTLSVSADGQNELRDLHVETNGLNRLIPWHLASLAAFFWLPIWIQKKSPQSAFLYFKDFKLAAIAIFWNGWLFRNRYRIAVEVHHYDALRLEKYVLRHADAAFCITSHLKGIVEKKIPSSDRLTVVAPDGANPDAFNVSPNIEELRKELDLPLGAKLIGYTGSFQTKGNRKGIETAIETLTHLDERCVLVVVGGEPTEIEEKKLLAQRLKVDRRVLFIGRVAHALIPRYLASFDLLIGPYPNNEFNSYFTSPLKLFEYMAAKRPIIVADLPSIRDILDEDTAYLCSSDDPRSYAQAIHRAMANPDEATLKAAKAFDLLKEKYTWEARAKNILSALYGHVPQQDANQAR